MTTWQAIGEVENFTDQSVTKIQIGNRSVAVYRISGEIFATSDNCTHGRASLSEGEIIGDNIECPMHQGRFHIPTGEAVGAPCVKGIRTFPTRIEAGQVWVGSGTDA